MLKFFLKSKDVLYQVLSDFGEVNSFYSIFFLTLWLREKIPTNSNSLWRGQNLGPLQIEEKIHALFHQK